MSFYIKHIDETYLDSANTQCSIGRHTFNPQFMHSNMVIGFEGINETQIPLNSNVVKLAIANNLETFRRVTGLHVMSADVASKTTLQLSENKKIIHGQKTEIGKLKKQIADLEDKLKEASKPQPKAEPKKEVKKK